MKNHFVILLLMVALIASCAPQNATEPPSIIMGQPTRTNPGMTAAEAAALTHLSETLNLPPGDIELISTEAVTWPDGCLGVQKIGVMCTQAEVEGYKIVFEVNGEQYEVHTDKNGSTVVVANGSDDVDAVEAQVIDQLANNLGLDPAEIAVVSNEAVEFGDACLGVAMQNVMCAEVVTPGSIIVLESNGIQYEYHVSEDGTRIQPATLALTWTRAGGFAGFCDSLTVFLSGEIYGNQCNTEPNEAMGIFSELLTDEEREQIDTWTADYGRATLDQSDPKGTVDGMVNIVELYGLDSGKPAMAVQEDIFLWAQTVFQKLYS
jgi:hypothetical protein